MLKGPYIAILVAFLLLLLIRISVTRRNEGFVANDENEGITSDSMMNSSVDNDLALARPPPGTMDLLSPPPAEFAPTKPEVTPSDTQSVLSMAASKPDAKAETASGSAYDALAGWVGAKPTDSPECILWKKAKFAANSGTSNKGDLGKDPKVMDLMARMYRESNLVPPAGC
jgi:hypothetical protein